MAEGMIQMAKVKPFPHSWTQSLSQVPSLRVIIAGTSPVMTELGVLLQTNPESL